jgi:quercetin dioxygenase-like cupin family protein
MSSEKTVSGSSRSVVLGPGEGRVLSLGPGADVTLKAVRQDSNGTISAYEFTLPPGVAGPPVHLHRGWDEVFYVLDGEMTFLIDGETSKAPAGSFVFVPRGIFHTFWNEGPAHARQLIVFTPSGIEDYFEELSSSLSPGHEPDLQEAIALLEKHDSVVPAGTVQGYGSLRGPATSPAVPD